MSEKVTINFYSTDTIIDYLKRISGPNTQWILEDTYEVLNTVVNENKMEFATIATIKLTVAPGHSAALLPYPREKEEEKAKEEECAPCEANACEENKE